MKPLAPATLKRQSAEKRKELRQQLHADLIFSCENALSVCKRDRRLFQTRVMFFDIPLPKHFRFTPKRHKDHEELPAHDEKPAHEEKPAHGETPAHAGKPLPELHEHRLPEKRAVSSVSSSSGDPQEKIRKIGNGLGRSSFWEPTVKKKRMRHVSRKKNNSENSDDSVSSGSSVECDESTSAVSTSDSEVAAEMHQSPHKKETTQTFTTNASRTAMVENMLRQHEWITAGATASSQVCKTAVPTPVAVPTMQADAHCSETMTRMQEYQLCRANVTKKGHTQVHGLPKHIKDSSPWPMYFCKTTEGQFFAAILTGWNPNGI